MAKIEAERAPSEKEFERALWYNVTRLFGEYGASQTDLSIIEYSHKLGYAIIRCSRAALPMVRAAIVAISRVGDEEIIPQVLSVSGTLKALRRKMSDIFREVKE